MFRCATPASVAGIRLRDPHLLQWLMGQSPPLPPPIVQLRKSLSKPSMSARIQPHTIASVDEDTGDVDCTAVISVKPMFSTVNVSFSYDF